MFISGSASNEIRWEPGAPVAEASVVESRSDRNGPKLSLCEIFELLRGRLPADTIPSCLEQLPFIPMTVDNEAATT
jgi:hypothetical protein